MYLLTMAMMSAVWVQPAPAEPGSSSGTVAGRYEASYSDGTSSDRLYRISLTGGGETWLRVACAGGEMSQARVLHARDAGSGMATGKRMHKPFTIRIEMDRAASRDSAALAKGKGKPSVASWDLATLKGARMVGDKTMSVDDWHQVVMHPSSPELCN